MSALRVFDMDGTLLHGTSASIEISRHLDRLDPLLELERRWVAEEITAAQFALEIRELWHDLTAEAVAEIALAAPAFPPLPFRLPVVPAGILTPADKVRLVEAERRAHGLPRSACVAYGDSLSDVPLFEALAHTIAVNADAGLEAIARVAYRGTDLTRAYAHGRALLDGAPQAAA